MDFYSKLIKIGLFDQNVTFIIWILRSKHPDWRRVFLISIGLDMPDDLIKDLDQALKAKSIKGKLAPVIYELLKKYTGENKKTSESRLPRRSFFIARSAASAGGNSEMPFGRPRLGRSSSEGGCPCSPFQPRHNRHPGVC